MGRFAIALLLLAAEPTKPSLALRVSPPITIAPLGTGCADILFTAEIRGPEDEAWYCPEVSWEWPDGTTSTTASDCPPFDARNACMESQEGCGLRGFRLEGDRIVDIVKECPCTIVGYPRRWTRRVCVPPHPNEGAWTIKVRLTRSGRTLAWQSVDVIVK